MWPPRRSCSEETPNSHWEHFSFWNPILFCCVLREKSAGTSLVCCRGSGCSCTVRTCCQQDSAPRCWAQCRGRAPGGRGSVGERRCRVRGRELRLPQETPAEGVRMPGHWPSSERCRARAALPACAGGLQVKRARCKHLTGLWKQSYNLLKTLKPMGLNAWAYWCGSWDLAHLFYSESVLAAFGERAVLYHSPAPIPFIPLCSHLPVLSVVQVDVEEHWIALGQTKMRTAAPGPSLAGKSGRCPRER